MNILSKIAIPIIAGLASVGFMASAPAEPVEAATKTIKSVTLGYESYTLKLNSYGKPYGVDPQALYPKKFIVKGSDGKILERNKDYKISYTRNALVGDATMVVTGINGYTGYITKQFIVKPPQETINVKSTNGAFRVYWQKGVDGTVGYQVKYSTDPNFKTNVHSWTTTNIDKLSENMSTYPKPGETWYVKVRAFYTKDGKTTSTRYGNYSKVKKITISTAKEKITKDFLGPNTDPYFYYNFGEPVTIYNQAGMLTDPNDPTRKLVYGKDYTVKYSNNINVTTTAKATATITGKGKFTGQFTTKFGIQPIPVTNLDVKAYVKAFIPKQIRVSIDGNYYKVNTGSINVYLKNSSGTSLVRERDYDVYYNFQGVSIKQATTINLELKFKGNYTGTWKYKNVSIYKVNESID